MGSPCGSGSDITGSPVFSSDEDIGGGTSWVLRGCYCQCFCYNIGTSSSNRSDVGGSNGESGDGGSSNGSNGSIGTGIAGWSGTTIVGDSRIGSLCNGSLRESESSGCSVYGTGREGVGSTESSVGTGSLFAHTGISE